MDHSTTSAALLERLTGAAPDPDAWRQFVLAYGPAVLRWCRDFGLQESDAHDVAQDVFLQFWRQSGRFRHDPSRQFRSYLRAMVHAALYEWSRRQKKGPAAAARAPAAALDDVAAPPGLDERLDDAYDRELLEKAVARVRSRVEPRTWDAFRLLALDGLSGEDASAALGMKLHTAYAARHKVLRLIREELARLDPG